MPDISRIPWDKVNFETLQPSYVHVTWISSSPAGVGIIVWDKEVGKANSKPMYCALFPESLQKAMFKVL